MIRLNPSISFGSDPNNESSILLGITPKEYSAEEILELPEKVAKKINKHIVICIDEFQQIGGLTSYQMNFLKAISDGVHNDFTSQKILSSYELGTKSNIMRIKNVLIHKELIEKTPEGIFFTDPIFKLWMKRGF